MVKTIIKTVETIKNKSSGFDIKIVHLKAPSDNEKDAILYDDIQEFYNDLVDKDDKFKKLKIVGYNRHKFMTLKAKEATEFLDIEDYYRNKPLAEKINKFYNVSFILFDY